MFVSILKWLGLAPREKRYCKQCAKLLKKENTLANLCPENALRDVRCAGSGRATVTIDGLCESPWCKLNHGYQLGRDEPDAWRR